MAYDFNGSSQYLRSAPAAVNGYPCTFAIWANLDSVATGNRLLSVADEGSASATSFNLSVVNVDATNGRFRAAASNGGSTQNATSSATFAAGEWRHVCGVFSSATSRTIYMDGGNSGTSTTSITPAAIMDSTTVGVRLDNTPIQYADGRLAEAAIWNVALTAAEVASLAKGASPATVRPESLVFYAPLVRELVEVVGGLTMTATGSPTVAAHPRVYGL